MRRTVCRLRAAWQIKKIIAGVTASQALIDAAIAKQADAILVHHGYFWKGEPPQLTGIKKTRVKSLLINDINLIAYHLPLDAHPELGNNAQLARMLNWQVAGQLWGAGAGVVWHAGRIPDSPGAGGSVVLRAGQAGIVAGQ